LQSIPHTTAYRTSLFVGLFVLTMASGCAYRFTNNYVKPPDGIRTVAIEAVYDTSREVVPHEELWGALQQAFARDGHLRVVPQKDADALVRARLKSASSYPIGDALGRKEDKEPSFPSGIPQRLEDVESKLRDLAVAGRYTEKESLAISVYVEVYDLRNQSVLMSKTYDGSAEFQSHRPRFRVPEENAYLTFSEVFEYKFRGISLDIAQAVVNDFLIR